VALSGLEHCGKPRASNRSGDVDFTGDDHNVRALVDLVILKPLAYDPVPTVSIVVAWKSGNASPLVRVFVDLVRQSVSIRKDAARLTGRPRKS